MTYAEAQRLALALMREHGLIDAGWRFMWSRGKRMLGTCQVRKVRDGKGGVREIRTIKLSHHLVALNSDDEVLDTILHEIAHALAGVERGHSAAWKAACVRIGARPERLAGEDVKVVPPRYAIMCGQCQSVLGRRHRRMRRERLANSYCRSCGIASKGTLRMQDTRLHPVA